MADLTTLRHGGRRAVRRTYERLGDHVVALPLLLLVTPESVRSRWVTTRTDLVVEGFPRSGNTYAALGIAIAQDPPIRVASHAHVPAQVKRAEHLGVPTLVTVRDPAATVCSMAVADRHHRVRDLIQYWVRYHTQLLALRDQIVVTDFTTVTQRLSEVIAALNERYALDLSAMPDDDATRRLIFAAIDEKQRAIHGDTDYHDAVPRPDPRRALARADREAELRATVEDATLTRARALYEELVDDL